MASNKDVLKKALAYLNQQKDRLSAPVPEKHVGHPETYRQYLRNEIKAKEAQIEALKLGEAGGDKK